MNRFLIIVLAFCVLSIQVHAQTIEQIISDSYKNKLKAKKEYYKKQIKKFEEKYKETRERTGLILMDKVIAGLCSGALDHISKYKRKIYAKNMYRKRLQKNQNYLANPNHPKFRKSRWDTERLEKEIKKLKNNIAKYKKEISVTQKQIDELKKALLRVPQLLQEAEKMHARTQNLIKESRTLPTPEKFIPKRLVYWQAGSRGMKGNPKKLSVPIIHGTYKGILSETIRYKGQTVVDEKNNVHEVAYHFYTNPKTNLVYIQRAEEKYLDKRFGNKDKIYYSRITYDRWSRKVAKFYINSPNDWHFHRNVSPFFSDSRRETRISNDGKILYTGGTGSVNKQDKIVDRMAIIQYRLELVKVADKPPIAFNNAIEIKLALIEEQKRKAREFNEKHKELSEAVFVGAMLGIGWLAWEGSKKVGGFVKEMFKPLPPSYRNQHHNYLTRAEAQEYARKIQADVQKQFKLQGTSIEEIYNSMSPEEKKEAERLGREMMGK